MEDKYSQISTLVLKSRIKRMRGGIDNYGRYGEMVRELNRRWEAVRSKLLETDNPDEQLQKAAIESDVGLVQYIKNPSEEIKRYAIEIDPQVIKYFPDLNEQLQLLAVTRDASSIQYIASPSENIQRLAISQDSDTIKFIKNPTYAAKTLAVSDSGDNIASIKRPDKTLQVIAAHSSEVVMGKKTICEAAQLVLVKKDGLLLEYIKNATSMTQRIAINENICALEFVTDPQVRIEGMKILNDKLVQIVRNSFEQLKEKRFFVSEADFQHALATQLKENSEMEEHANVYLEFPIYQNDKLIYVDIMVEMAGFLFPIELKYKTKCISKCCQPYEQTGIPIKDILKDHGAQDLGGYYFWKDINRIETLVADNRVVGGICIMVTNDAYYWEGRCKDDTQGYAFRLNGGQHNNGFYDWALKDKHKIAKYVSDNPGFNIKHDYTFQWKMFYEMLPQNGTFMSLFIEVPNDM